MEAHQFVFPIIGITFLAGAVATGYNVHKKNQNEDISGNLGKNYDHYSSLVGYSILFTVAAPTIMLLSYIAIDKMYG